jgi:hypothetical protein
MHKKVKKKVRQKYSLINGEEKIESCFIFLMGKMYHQSPICPEFNRCTIYEEPDLSLQPQGIKKKMYLHQLRSLSKMLKLEEENIITYTESDPRYVKDEGIISFSTSIGFLSDVPGYGKSLTMLALLSLRPVLNKRQLMPKGNHGERFFYTIKGVDLLEDKEPVIANLIIVPFSIVNQWKGYLLNDCTFSYYVIEKRKDIPKSIEEARSIFNSYSCILLSNNMYQHMIGFDVFNFSRVIYDEIDSIELKGATVQSPPLGYFTWYITATIENIINIHGPDMLHQEDPLKYAYAGYNKYRTGMYISNMFKGYPLHKETIQNTIIVKNDLDYISRTINIPQIIKFKYVVRNTVLNGLVTGIVSDDVIMMLNAGDEKGALESLKISSSSETSVVRMLAQNLTTELNNLQVEEESIKKMVYKSEKQKEEALDRVEEKIVECKKKIDILQNRLADKLSSTDCSICFEEFDENRCKMITKCCNLVTCGRCIFSVINSCAKCPICAGKLTKDLVCAVGEENDNSCKECKPEKPVKELLTKADCLVDILEKRNYKTQALKILIFSDYDASFAQSEDVLKSMGIPTFTLSGQIDSRIKRFEEATTTTVFFLNSQYFGAGLNLTFCTDIIEWHKLPDSRRTQIIGRGQRLGREVPLHFWQIFYENENT